MAATTIRPAAAGHGLSQATRRFSRAALAVLAWTLAGCAVPGIDGSPPPPDVYELAVVPGLPHVRGWGDDLSDGQIEAARAALAERLTERWQSAGQPAEGLSAEILGLSGGGPDGAFAAGLLAGWSAAGDRPEFDLVTGVSVGALIAPFAYLGPAYDERLRRLITEVRTDDILSFDVLAVLFGALAVADPQALRARVADVVDAPMLAEIAQAHRDGRRLLVVTTNIDAGRPVLWDMGAIAMAGNRDLFIDVMLASASVPGAMPPVAIEVEALGERYVELHVDGGVTRSVTIGPTGVTLAFPDDLGFPVERHVFIIQNNEITPRYAPVERTLPALATRTVSTLIRAQSAGDLTQIYLEAQRTGATFNLAFVPAGLGSPSSLDFDPEIMGRLYAAAFDAARDGVEWLHAPPGVVGYSKIRLTAGDAAELAEPEPGSDD